MIEQTKYEKIKAIGKNISERAYRARCYANFYGGPVLTAGGTIAAFRYMMFPAEYNGPLSEAVAWTSAAITSLPLQIFSIPVGLAMGMTSVVELAQSRAKKDRTLEICLAPTGLPRKVIDRH